MNSPPPGGAAFRVGGWTQEDADVVTRWAAFAVFWQCTVMGMLWGELRGAGEPPPVGWVCTPSGPWASTQLGVWLQEPPPGQPENYTETKWLEPFD